MTGANLAHQFAALNNRLGELEFERNELHDRLNLLVALQEALRGIAGGSEAADVIERMLRCTRDVLGFSRALYFSARGAAGRMPEDERDHTETKHATDETYDESPAWDLAGGLDRCYVGSDSDLCAPLVDTRAWFVLARLGINDELGFLYADGHRRRTPGGWETQLVRTLAAVAGVSFANAQSLERANVLAMRDALTGLLNRRAFEQRLRQEVEACRRYDRSFALVVVDLDDFKRVNDTHGHAHGDHVLKSVAAALADATRAEDVVARFGGDEFVALLVNGEPNLTRQTIARIAVHLETQALRCSLGVALFPRDALDAQELFETADAALYAAKAAGKNRYAFYRDDAV